jgi:Ca2+-binding EF-hand superfamily protein
MDKNGNGKVEIDDLIDIYNVDKHPEFTNGKKTKEEILDEFMNTFE